MFWDQHGVSHSLVSETALHRIRTLLPSASTFRSYTEQCVGVQGLFMPEVEQRGELHYLPTHSVRKSSHPSLLGRNWFILYSSYVESALPLQTVFDEQQPPSLTGSKARFEADTQPEFFHPRAAPTLWHQSWRKKWIVCRKRASSNNSSTRSARPRSCQLPNQTGRCEFAEITSRKNSTIIPSLALRIFKLH